MKRIRQIVIAITLITGLFINVLTLSADDDMIHIPWSPEKPSVGKMIQCVEYLGDGWTRGSVEWICYTQWVCPSCYCVPEACGQVSIKD